MNTVEFCIAGSNSLSNINNLHKNYYKLFDFDTVSYFIIKLIKKTGLFYGDSDDNQVSRKYGVSTRIPRYYEQVGLIPKS